MRAALLALALALVARSADAAAASPLPGDSVYQLGASLTESSGQPVDFGELRGRPRLVTFFYANCRATCPLIIESLKAIERQLAPAERKRLGFVLISMDPERDTPAVLQAVQAQRHLDPARWTLLQPRPDQLRALGGALGLRYRALADGEINHTTAIVLLDPDGRIVARSEHIGGTQPPEFLAAVHRAGAD